MNKLKIPYAFTQNKNIVKPQKANKHDKFTCPQCDNKVVLKKGKIRQPHFAHKKDTECSLESVQHIIAKEMIVYACENPTNMIHPHHDPLSPTDVLIFRKCQKCGNGAYGNILVGDIGDIDAVETEVRVGNYRVDVAFMSCGIPEYAIEVVHTHKVEDKKWDDFAKWEFPCIEVKCQDVIDSWEHSQEDMPSFRNLFLKPIQHNFNNNLILEQRYRYDCQHCNPELFSEL